MFVPLRECDSDSNAVLLAVCIRIPAWAQTVTGSIPWKGGLTRPAQWFPRSRCLLRMSTPASSPPPPRTAAAPTTSSRCPSEPM